MTPESSKLDFRGLEPFVDGDTVCRFLAVSSTTLHRLTSRGQIPAYRTGKGKGSPYRFRLSEVDRWMRGRRSRALTT